MATDNDFPSALTELDLGPLQVELETAAPSRRVDAYLTLRWGDEAERFATEFKQARVLRDLRNAVWQARERATDTGRPPLLVVPYLNDEALDLLQQESMSGLDLSGNGVVELPGRWRFFQRGFPSRYPTQRQSRAPYRGKSALVGRALLARPWYEAVGEVQEEIERRGGTLSLSQVSKVLSALEDDLVIRKTSDEIQLLQPAKLLDALAEDYRRPKPVETVEAKAALGPAFYAALRARAEARGVRLVGYDPQRYVVAPEARERLVVYVEPGAGSDLAAAFELEPAVRFANVVVQAVDEPGVYFDAREADGFRWCAPLEVYVQLMQGGKREQESALQLRADLLATASGGRG